MNEIRGFYNAAIHPDRINVYYESLLTRRSNSGQYCFDDNSGLVVRMGTGDITSRSHKNTISKNARRKIERAVNYLVYIVPRCKRFTTADGRSGNHFLTFITLTLSSKQIHSDNEIKRDILEPFLGDLRKRWKADNYIWRAEQQENGNLHFHILTDRFIWWAELRDAWNYFQERLGYVSRYRLAMREHFKNGFRISENIRDKRSVSVQLSAYRKNLRTDWNQPNSTDIHSLKNIVSVRSYVTKYLTKADQVSSIAGRLWGCSYELSRLTGSRNFYAGQVADEIDKLSGFEGVSVCRSDYFVVIFFPPGQFLKDNFPLIYSELQLYIHARFPDYQEEDLFKQAA